MVAHDLETRIDRLEARAALAELCTHYGIACDFRDMTKLASLFTPDVVIRSVGGGMNARGREAAMAMFNRMFLIRGPAYHWTHDRLVTFDDADRDQARGLVLSHAETTPNGTASLAALRYHDRYRRIDGQWYFAERILSFFYYVPVAQYAERLPSAARVFADGGWAAADFPEGDPTWVAWHAEHRPA